MSYFNELDRKGLEDVIEIRTTCWKCKELVEEKDMVTVTDGKTKWVELCRDCYDFYRDIKKFSDFGKKRS
ncbi:hypothetical protein LF817_10060 [Halobacillus sp. A1]|uniref:hypothetical protein n=1 Tax=Halobacillus sp. A1 TaxID=2880262 RepID=UPI0020A66F25|nr:hypothetical protein [Halobacillus sp. A1]MCP3031696.1 hypothetical protein [Halobacillus sp. A1]